MEKKSIYTLFYKCGGMYLHGSDEVLRVTILHERVNVPRCCVPQVQVGTEAWDWVFVCLLSFYFSHIKNIMKKKDEPTARMFLADQCSKLR